MGFPEDVDDAIACWKELIQAIADGECLQQEVGTATGSGIPVNVDDVEAADPDIECFRSQVTTSLAEVPDGTVSEDFDEPFCRKSTAVTFMGDPALDLRQQTMQS